MSERAKVEVVWMQPSDAHDLRDPSDGSAIIYDRPLGDGFDTRPYLLLPVNEDGSVQVGECVVRMHTDDDGTQWPVTEEAERLTPDGHPVWVGSNVLFRALLDAAQGAVSHE